LNRIREFDRIIGVSKDTTRLKFFGRDPELVSRREVGLSLVVMDLVGRSALRRSFMTVPQKANRERLPAWATEPMDAPTMG
jgi:hypothetical protein